MEKFKIGYFLRKTGEMLDLQILNYFLSDDSSFAFMYLDRIMTEKRQVTKITSL